MHRSITLAFFLAAIAVLAHAAPSPLPLTVDSRQPTAPGLDLYRASARTIRVTFTDGGATSDITGATPFLSWATNSTATAIATASVSVVSATGGVADCTFSAAALNHTPGRYMYECGLINSGVVTVSRQGVLTLRGSPYGAGATPQTWGTNVNWAAYTWIGLPAWGYISAADTQRWNSSASATSGIPERLTALEGYTGTVATALQPGATNAVAGWLASYLPTATYTSGTNAIAGWFAPYLLTATYNAGTQSLWAAFANYLLTSTFTSYTNAQAGVNTTLYGYTNAAAQGSVAFGWGNHASAGYVGTNDTRYLAALTNAGQFATAEQGALADAALPKTATNDWTVTSHAPYASNLIVTGAATGGGAASNGNFAVHVTDLAPRVNNASTRITSLSHTLVEVAWSIHSAMTWEFNPYSQFRDELFADQTWTDTALSTNLSYSAANDTYALGSSLAPRGNAWWNDSGTAYLAVSGLSASSGGGYTFAHWLFATNGYGAGSGADVVFDQTDRFVLSDHAAGGETGAWVYDGGWSSVSGAWAVIPTGTWLHVAWVFQSDGSLAFYSNGVSVGTASVSLKALGAGAVIGQAVGGAAASWCIDGAIDEYGIWTRPLTAGEIEDLTLNPAVTLGGTFADSGTKYTNNLAAYWSFDETGVTVYTSLVNDVTATVTDGPSVPTNATPNSAVPASYAIYRSLPWVAESTNNESTVDVLIDLVSFPAATNLLARKYVNGVSSNMSFTAVGALPGLTNWYHYRAATGHGYGKTNAVEVVWSNGCPAIIKGYTDFVQEVLP